jgi:hypothetical protein
MLSLREFKRLDTSNVVKQLATTLINHKLYKYFSAIINLVATNSLYTF